MVDIDHARLGDPWTMTSFLVGDSEHRCTLAWTMTSNEVQIAWCSQALAKRMARSG